MKENHDMWLKAAEIPHTELYIKYQISENEDKE